MEQQLLMPNPDRPSFLKTWGFWAVLLGATALLLVFIQIFGPTFETRPSAGTQIGEIAGEMKRSAWRSFLGLSQPVPEPVSPSIWSYAVLAGPVLAIVAIVLSLVSGVLKENRRYAVYGASFGATAIVFQFFWWIALLICGVLLIVTIIENIGDIFSF